MERIILNRNLKFVLEPLNIEQRGELFTALFNGAYHGVDHIVDNVFQYIKSLQEETEIKRLKMKEIGAIGRAAQKKNKDAATAAPVQCEKRKETKEIRENNLNILNSSHKSLLAKENNFNPPLLAEVADFIQQQKLNVNADTFVNFYQARGWKIGTVPMQNWQAIVKLWHARAEKKILQKNMPVYMQKDDEIYWQQLQSRALKSDERGCSSKEDNHE